ncbi:hypothetical protein BDV06DRAFT_193580 [Aspergillus oleicola]
MPRQILVVATNMGSFSCCASLRVVACSIRNLGIDYSKQTLSDCCLLMSLVRVQLLFTHLADSISFLRRCPDLES